MFRRFIVVLLVMLAVDVGRAEAPRACFYPINARMFHLSVEGQEQSAKFVRDEEEPQALLGLGGWQGQLERGQATLMRAGKSGQPVEGYMFRNGRLTSCLRNGHEVRVDSTEPPRLAATLPDLWPEELKEEDEREKNIWRQDGRLKFGFVNPNFAAAFLGSLAFLFLPLALGVRHWLLRAAGWAGVAAAVACVLATGSRGGLLATAAGMAVYFAFSFRRFFSWKRLALVAAVLVVTLGTAFALHVGDRFTRRMFAMDQANSERVDIWRAVPRMMVDAPAGWGAGQSGAAYSNWYRANDSVRYVRTMISSHLTVLAETGWPLRFAYVFVWAWFLFSAFGEVRRGRPPFALATGVFFGIAAMFNTVMAGALSWPVPLMALAWHLRGVVGRGRRPSWVAVTAAACVSLLVLGVFVGLGLRDARTVAGREPSIRGADGVAYVNGREPTVWFVEDGFVLDGGYLGAMGREVRDAYMGDVLPAMAFTREAGKVPAAAQKAVFAGKAGTSFLEAWKAGHVKDPPREIVFLSPPFSAESVPEGLAAASRVRLVRGEFVPRTGSETVPQGLELVKAPGSLLYVPGWLKL